MRIGLIATLALFSAACFLDATGEAHGGGGGGAGTGGVPSSGGTSSGGAAAGAGGSGIGGVPETGGGGGVQAVCGDGLVEPPEECEDDNTDETDTCRACAVFSTCGDSAIGPNEECEEQSADCADCVLTQGPCFDAPPLLSGYFPNQTTNGAPPAFVDTSGLQGCQGTAALEPANVFRFDAGPYPRGMTIFVTDLDTMGPDDMDPFLVATLGCGESALACDYRGSAFTLDPEVAFMVTRVLPPHTIAYVGIGDNNGQNSHFDEYVGFHRFYELFETDVSTTWQLDPEWAYDGSGAIVAGTDNDAVAQRATTPSVFVGGLDGVRLGIWYTLANNASCSARIAASADDEPSATVGDDLPPGFIHYEERELTLASATHLKGAIEFDDVAGSGCTMQVYAFGVIEPDP